MTISVNNNIMTAMAPFERLDGNTGGHAGQFLAAFSGGRGGVNVDGGSGDDEINIGAEANASTGSDNSPDPVAANEHGQIWNDPQFRGGDGGRFDIQGEAGKSYNLFSDSGIQLNGQFDGFNGDGTAVGKTGLTVTGTDGETSQISFGKDGTATINGQAMEQGKQYTLADGGTAELNGKRLTVTTAEAYRIKQEAYSWGDKFINVDVSTGADGVNHGQMPGGLLGQTFDADDVARNGKTGHGAQGEGAIDGKVQDYETGGLFTQSDPAVPATGPINVNGGSGDDVININGPVNGPVNVDGGSGDDVINIGSGQPAPDPVPVEDPVAANETGTIKGDPHFVGGDGGRYDVQGEAGKIYDLLSDNGLDFRGRFDDFGNGATVVGETGLTVGEGWNSDNINFRKDGTAYINDQQMEAGKTYDLADGGTAKLENGTLSVTTAEGYTINQTAKNGGGKAYIDTEVKTGENGVDHGQIPGGLLGQSFDADSVARNGSGSQGQGAIDGDVSDYEKPGLDPLDDKRAEKASPDSEFQQLVEQLEQMLEQLMDMLEKLKNAAMPDPVKIPDMETHTDAGSGDDKVNITAPGIHTVDLGSGDDEAFVNFNDPSGNSSATIQGGSGDDTVTLAGSASDYSVSHEDGYNVYTDQDGNSVKVADDVEQVRFESEAA